MRLRFCFVLFFFDSCIIILTIFCYYYLISTDLIGSVPASATSVASSPVVTIELPGEALETVVDSGTCIAGPSEPAVDPPAIPGMTPSHFALGYDLLFLLLFLLTHHSFVLHSFLQLPSILTSPLL
jgi:hypothetical protein